MTRFSSLYPISNRRTTIVPEHIEILFTGPPCDRGLVTSSTTKQASPLGGAAILTHSTPTQIYAFKIELPVTHHSASLLSWLQHKTE